MIKRPLSVRLTQPVLEGRKFTTIRDDAWPVGVEIMLYNWSGRAYRSKHVDVAVVMVEETRPMRIDRIADVILYEVDGPHMQLGAALWYVEGFDSQEEMDAWFRATLRPGATVQKVLMKFRLVRRVERSEKLVVGSEKVTPPSPSGNLGGFQLLRGKLKEGQCAECAVVHPPEQPHNQQSLFWQYSFMEKHGRWPTWADALAHCSTEVRDQWVTALAEHGVTVPNPEEEGHE